VPTLYQAEWCPYSAAVRELLTEVGVDFVARQVEPWPEERRELIERTGSDTIPVLEDDDGTFHRGTRAIFRYVQSLEPWEHGPAHRRRFLDHLPARESDAVGKLVARAELRPAHPPGEPSGAVSISDNRDESRYELRLGDTLVGLAAYQLRDGRIALTHTEVDEACEHRGLATRLVAAALDDARERGLEVLPLCPFVAAYVRRHPEVQDLVR
jgi:predicted GNAT family acetyltransferase/glutaredoxin